MLEIVKVALTSKYVRKGVLIVAIIIALVVGGTILHHHIYENGYSAGVQYQTQVFQKEQDTAKAKLEQQQVQADKDRAGLNNTIQTLTDKSNALQQKLDEKYAKQKQEVIDYAKSSEGSGTCFRPSSNGLRLLNESFPASN